MGDGVLSFLPFTRIQLAVGTGAGVLNSLCKSADDPTRERCSRVQGIPQCEPHHTTHPTISLTAARAH